MCVQDVDVQCVLQFTLIHAAGCALHRRVSRVIHRIELYLHPVRRADSDEQAGATTRQPSQRQPCTRGRSLALVREDGPGQSSSSLGKPPIDNKTVLGTVGTLAIGDSELWEAQRALPVERPSTRSCRTGFLQLVEPPCRRGSRKGAPSAARQTCDSLTSRAVERLTPPAPGFPRLDFVVWGGSM